MRTKLSKGYNERGAFHGRSAWLPVETEKPVKLRMEHCPLDSGGYDPGGAYWGLRTAGSVVMPDKRVLFVVQKLYWVTSEEETMIVCGRQDTIISDPRFGRVEIMIEAVNREDAKQKVRELMPNARFYR